MNTGHNEQRDRLIGIGPWRPSKPHGVVLTGVVAGCWWGWRPTSGLVWLDRTIYDEDGNSTVPAIGRRRSVVAAVREIRRRRGLVVQDALYKIRKLFDEPDWRYSARKLLQQVRQEAWQAGYLDGLNDAYGARRDEEQAAAEQEGASGEPRF